MEPGVCRKELVQLHKVSVLPGVAASPFNVLANDFDAEADPFTLVSQTLPALGTLTPLGGGQFIYTPNPGVAKATDQFTYTIKDGLNRTASAKVTISIGVHRLRRDQLGRDERG